MMGWLELPFEAVPSLFDEKAIRDTNPESLTQKLSRAKALSVKANYPDSVIIGSDAVVAFNGQILEKATGAEDQSRLIKMQMGKEAEVYTSVYAINALTRQDAIRTVIVPYKMANVADAKIDEYVESGKGMDKAGGYGLQDLDGIFLESINGCYSGALGFPVCKVSEILQEMGVGVEVDIKKVVREKTGKNC